MPFLFLCTAFMIGLSLQHVRLFTAFHCRIAALPWRSTASRCPFHRPSLACRCSITASPYLSLASQMARADPPADCGGA